MTARLRRFGTVNQSSYDSIWMVHSRYPPLKHTPLMIVFGWCTGYPTLKHTPLMIVFDRAQ